MKQKLLLVVLLVVISFLSNCHSAKKVSTEKIAPKVTYETNLQPVISANCSPCHIPSKGGNKKPFDSYDAVKSNIDSMISRIELNPGQKGFMPFKKPKLSDSTINIFKQWRDNGMLN